MLITCLMYSNVSLNRVQCQFAHTGLRSRLVGFSLRPARAGLHYICRAQWCHLLSLPQTATTAPTRLFQSSFHHFSGSVPRNISQEMQLTVTARVRLVYSSRFIKQRSASLTSCRCSWHPFTLSMARCFRGGDHDNARPSFFFVSFYLTV